jgi:hypothetical protein
MTHEQFIAFATVQFAEYEKSPGFKVRVTKVLERQAAGEDLTIREIAQSLGLPLWLAEMALISVMAEFQGRVILSDENLVN